VGLKCKSQSRDPSIGKGRGEKHERAVIGSLPLPVINSCLRRIFRWRVPPNWSVSDWRNEMRAEAACASWQAVRDYDPSLGVPLSAFAWQRMLTSTLTRYRQEWAYALRLAQERNPEDPDSSILNSTTSAVFDDWSKHALARLSKPDLWLVEELFLRDRTEAEVATQIGITQQAVSKRKSIILFRLRQYMVGTSSRHRFSSATTAGTRRGGPGSVRPSKD
jgi:hypothetical protein